MQISKNIKILLSVMAIILVFIIIIYKKTTPAFNNDIEISTSNKDVNIALDSEIVPNNENESTNNEIKKETEELTDEDESKEVESTESEKESVEDEQEAPEDIIGNDLPIIHSPEHSGSFVIINSVGYEKFKFSKYNVDVYIESVNNYAKNSAEQTKIYNLIVPTSSEFNMPDEYKNLSDSQKEGILYAYSNMNEKIVTVDAYSNMEAYKDEYLYFKTDHHWTALGAYRAYESFIKAKGEAPIPLDTYSKIESENKYLGSIYNMTKNERLENNLDDIWYYKPLFSVEYLAVNRDDTKWSARQVIFPSYFESKSKYAAFMGGDTAFSHIKVNSGKENKIIVIKDSYGNAFIPFLLPHYGDIFVADPRYFKENIYEVIEEYKIDEVLIINYATVLQLPGFCQMLGDMGAAVVDEDVAIDDEINDESAVDIDVNNDVTSESAIKSQ